MDTNIIDIAELQKLANLALKRRASVNKAVRDLYYRRRQEMAEAVGMTLEEYTSHNRRRKQPVEVKEPKAVRAEDLTSLISAMTIEEKEKALRKLLTSMGDK